MVFIAFRRSLVLNLSQVAGDLEQVGDKQKPGIRVFGAINIFLENKMLVLEVRVMLCRILTDSCNTTFLVGVQSSQ